jgi:hypothetical protein
MPLAYIDMCLLEREREKEQEREREERERGSTAAVQGL